jgi:hypothetical protein
MTDRARTPSGGAIATVHLWDVRPARVPGACVHVARDRFPGRRPPGMTFGKLVGTGSGRTFTPRDADPLRWGLVAAWEDRAALDEAEETGPLLGGWRARSARTSRIVLHPLSSRGSWARRQPFVADGNGAPTGPVAGLTRARLRPSAMRRFWAAVPSVTADLQESPGVRFTIGIGEAPIGLQGTFSVWQSAAALRSFAYEGAAHRQVIDRTPRERWYAEELFARFAVLEADPLFGVDLPGPPAGTADR